jgi:hypothetical protein
MSAFDLQLAGMLVKLKRLDFIIHVRILGIPQVITNDSDLQGLVISEQETEGLLAETSALVGRPSQLSKLIPEYKTMAEAIENEMQTIQHVAVRLSMQLYLEQLLYSRF